MKTVFSTLLLLLLFFGCIGLSRKKVNLDLSSPEKNYLVFKAGLKKDSTLFHSFLCLSGEMQKKYSYFSRFYPFFTKAKEGILLRKVLIVSSLQNKKDISDSLTILVINYNKYKIEVPYTRSIVSYIDQETGEEHRKEEWKVDLDVEDYIDRLTNWYNDLTLEEKRKIEAVEYKELKAWDASRPGRR